MHIVLRSLFFWCGVSASNFDSDRRIEVELNKNDISERSYFGYKLLLQKGPNPIFSCITKIEAQKNSLSTWANRICVEADRGGLGNLIRSIISSRVIVGSPKQSNITGGAVFGCNIYYLEGPGCTKYNITVYNNMSFNGNFLGSALDGGENVGDPFIVCAPRKVSLIQVINEASVYLRGTCLYKKKSTLINEIVASIQPLQKLEAIGSYFVNGRIVNYYHYAYGQAGFDVSYNKNLSSVYMGAVGVRNWQGSAVVQSLNDISKYEIMPDASLALEEHGFLGYKVEYGIFNQKFCVIAGAPRGNDLRGRVVVFYNPKSYHIIRGEEFGSYFGAAILAEDVDNNKSDDLFVGAPMASGASFDEGCVYYYKDVKQQVYLKLFGSKKRGSRFGTNIVSLGDIDLDSFNDVAISAPFEDNGVGAVYIYKGSAKGINPTYSQRLSPSEFSGNYGNLRGFGMGLSRGVDVDGNGFNDLAIGAYISGRVFIFTTRPIIDFRTTLESNVTSIPNNSYISITYCVKFVPRVTKAKLILKDVTFQLKLRLDFRAIGMDSYVENITSYPSNNTCRTVNVTVQQSTMNFLPFKYSLTTQVLSDVYAEGTNVIEKSIPYAHGCGEDNICQTQILLNVMTNSDTVILGQTKRITVTVSADNVGETGYQCYLNIKIPKEIEIKLERQCHFENSSYICLFANKLDTNSKKQMIVPFEVVSNDIALTSITINFELKCLGINLDSATDTVEFKVIVRNSVYVKGKSDPENFEFFDNGNVNETNIKILHTFSVSNFGPSPAKTDVYFLVPIIKLGKRDLLEFVEVQSSVDGDQIQCERTDKIQKIISNYDVTSLVKAPPNRTTVVDCFHGTECLEIFCGANIIYKSAQTPTYSLIFNTNSDLLGEFFHEQRESKNILAFVSTAIVSNGTTVLEAHTPTLIFLSHSKNIPMWVYVVGAVIGAFLLCLMVLLLFKCKFFERQYRDKLYTEQLIGVNQDNEEPPSPTPLEKLEESDEEEGEGTKFSLEFE